MCGVVGYIGKVDNGLIGNLVYESGIRGLHFIGSKFLGNAGVYHTRYCTSGEDNQPLFLENRWLVFNGVIDMGTKEEIEERYNIKMLSDNDGEILLHKCHTDEELIEFLRNKRVTCAGIILTEDRLIAFRNSGRPLWVYEENDQVLIASTKDIFNRCGIYNCIEIPALTIISWTI